MPINPYQISIPDSKLEELKQRLALTTLPTQLNTDRHWDVGTPVSDIDRLVKYWKSGFDWRKAEAKLNELPHFMTSIKVDDFGELDIHFVHQISPVKGAIPLLFCHGWPGSFIEIKKLLPLIHGKGEFPAFHIVAPSLPNFGFSSGVTQEGFGCDKYAETLHKLMLKLEYDEYVTQGGDWGFSITRAMGIAYPTHCKASHLNLVLSKPPVPTRNPLLYLKHLFTPYTPYERAGLTRTSWFDNTGFSYNTLQSTKPQTIGFALADSPAGALAWILEKLHDWADTYAWTDEEILTWISIYWFSTAGPAASVRIYYEDTHPAPGKFKVGRVCEWVDMVKLGLAYFPRDIQVRPRLWGRTLGPVAFESVHENGGHFATWEQPEAVVGDLVKMFGKGGPCFGIVSGKDGYA